MKSCKKCRAAFAGVRCLACKRAYDRARQAKHRRDPKLRKVVKARLSKWATSPHGREQKRIIKQRARSKQTAFVWDRTLWAECLARFDHACVYCGTRNAPLQMDHFIPLVSPITLGTQAANVVPACGTCNGRKSGHDPYLVFPWDVCDRITAKLYDIVPF